MDDEKHYTERRYLEIDNCANCPSLGYDTKTKWAFCIFFLNRQESNIKFEIEYMGKLVAFPVIESYTDIKNVDIPMWCHLPNPENMKAIDEP